MKKIQLPFCSILTGILVAVASIPSTALAGEIDTAEIFEKLKGLQGTWHGEAVQVSGEEHESGSGTLSVTHEFRVSSAGSVVMEIMGPGSDHEMINMYHLDGKDLMLTHYCSIGNQPSMRLDRNGSTPSSLKFDFAGGTNLDPEVDHHIHNSKILFSENGGLQSLWTSYAQGKQAAVMKFTLFRAQD